VAVECSLLSCGGGQRQQQQQVILLSRRRRRLLFTFRDTRVRTYVDGTAQALAERPRRAAL